MRGLPSTLIYKTAGGHREEYPYRIVDAARFGFERRSQRSHLCDQEGRHPEWYRQAVLGTRIGLQGIGSAQQDRETESDLRRSNPAHSECNSESSGDCKEAAATRCDQSRKRASRQSLCRFFAQRISCQGNLDR